MLQWFDAVFVVLIVPATFAVAWVARRGAPRLATTGAVLALTGFLAGISQGGTGDLTAYLTAQNGLDVATMTALDEASWANPVVGLSIVAFLFGLTVGLSLLGLALWRSRVAPAWMGVALLVGGLTHPFLPGGLLQGAGLVLAAVGFAGASLALLRMRNDAFDLPPARADAA